MLRSLAPVLVLAWATGRPQATAAPLEGVTRWWAFLGRVSPGAGVAWRQAAAGAGLVVLNHGPQVRLGELSPATIRLAYLSVGEAEVGRAYWPTVRGRSFVVEPNPNWSHNVRVDIRDRRWQEILLEQEAPRLLAQGYQGLMLDTLDVAPYLEARDPVRFAGSRQALRELMAHLRRAFPEILLLANGTAALVDAAPYVDGYVTEGIFATYDFGTPGYRATTADERAWRLAQLDAALARARHPVFAIEYAPPPGTDGGLGAWAEREARARGFLPFVTSKDVDRLPPPHASGIGH